MANMIKDLLAPDQAKLLDDQLRRKQLQEGVTNYGNDAMGKFLTAASGAQRASAGFGMAAERAVLGRQKGPTELRAIEQKSLLENQVKTKQAINQATKASVGETDLEKLGKLRDSLLAMNKVEATSQAQAIQKRIDAIEKQNKAETQAQSLVPYKQYLSPEFKDTEVIKDKITELDAKTDPASNAMAKALRQRLSKLTESNIRIVDGVAVDINKFKHNDVVNAKTPKPLLSDAQVQAHVASGILTADQARQVRGSTDATLVYDLLAKGSKNKEGTAVNAQVKSANTLLNGAIDEGLFMNSPSLLAKAQTLANKGDVAKIQTLLNQQEKTKADMDDLAKAAEKTQPEAKAVTLNPYGNNDAIYVDYVENKLKDVSEENPKFNQYENKGLFPVVEYEDGLFGDNAEEYMESFLKRQQITYDFKAFIVNRPSITFEKAYELALRRSLDGEDISYVEGATVPSGSGSSVPSSSSTGKYDPKKRKDY